MNRVGGEMPIGAGGHAVAERLDELDVVTLEAELDARARERVGFRALALDSRLAQEQPESRELVELHRVTPRREVAAVDRHGSPTPHAIVAFEAYPIRDDDVRLGGIGAAAVVDRRAARGVQLERVPYAPQRPVIGQVGAAQDRVDFHRAGPSPGCVGGRGGSLDEGDEDHGGHHWFGRVNFPPVPLGRTAVTTLKSGSDVNPSPSMWRVGSSNTNGRSELT